VSTHPSREPPQGIEKFEAISLSPRLVPSYPLNVAWLVVVVLTIKIVDM
jgi:hypothetical protein